MVARSLPLQDLPYSRLLQVPDEEREFLTLDELKPHQLTELGVTSPNTQNTSSTNNENNNQTIHSGLQPNFHHNVYYDLNSAPSPSNSSCNSIYLSANTGGNEHMTPSSLLHPSNAMSVSSIDTTNIQSSQHQHAAHIGNSRKRKFSFTETSDFEDETGDDSKSVRTADDNKKQNHSEIEKRRRDKMNTYITELSAMVPMCHAMSRKLDKLTVLRMAVQHLKTIRGAVHSYTEGHYKPAFLSDQELKLLILQAAEGFLFVVGCDRGRILYVSESVSQTLNYSQGDLLGQSWFDILHPKDVAKVKEQLSSSDLSPRERLIDAKTMLPVKTDVPQGVSRLCPGARRSFFCRMKCKVATQVKEESDSNTSTVGCHRRKKQLNSDKKYSVIQCTGYLKSWAPAKIGLEEHEKDSEGDSCNLSCLVAVGRVQPSLFNNLKISDNSNNATNLNKKPLSRNNIPNLRNIQFISRHAMDGKFLFVDQRATLVLGFLPQELLGSSMYEYYHPDDIPALAESHKAALQGNECVTTSVYRLRTKDNEKFVRLQSEWKSFRNPWTKELEYLIAKNNVILSEIGNIDNNNSSRYQNGSNCNKSDETNGINQQPPGGSYDFFNQSNGREMHRIINTHVEASKIGRQIAEQVLDFQRRVSNSSAESSPDPDTHNSNVNQNSVNTTTADNSMSSNDQVPTSELSASRARVSPTTNNIPQRVNGTLPGYNHVRSNSIISPENGAGDAEMIQMISENTIAETPQSTNNDGNDEAAMAVIMSLLEADAGLGGPVDFSGLPWPLP